MPKVFNPPPNWPAAPEGWTPPPGWQPDPTWGPPPTDWQLWVRPNPHPFGRAMAVAAVVYTALVVALVPAGLTAYAAGELIAAVLVPALVVGFIARASRRRWPWWKFVVAVLLGIAAALLLQAFSDVQAA